MYALPTAAGRGCTAAKGADELFTDNPSPELWGDKEWPDVGAQTAPTALTA